MRARLCSGYAVDARWWVVMKMARKVAAIVLELGMVAVQGMGSDGNGGGNSGHADRVGEQPVRYPTYWQNGRRLTLIQSASVPETTWWAIMRGLRSSLIWNETMVSNTWYARKLHATSSPPRL